MDQNYLLNYIKDFETETKQIQYWFNTLNDIKSQINLLKESTDSETKLLETLGKGLQLASKSYCNETEIYTDEPSQFWLLTTNFTAMLETIGKVFSEDTIALNDCINKYCSYINSDVNDLIKNINENTANLMRELLDFKKNSASLQQKYSKLKEGFESAHMNKKKLETDPKNMYNVTLKEKAEQKILVFLKELQELMPQMESNSKEIEEKKILFNKNMKESFELVLSCIFKNNVKIKQALFISSKEKTNILARLKLYITDRYRKIREIDFSLNDYNERKYAESKNNIFDSLESIVLRDDDYGVSLVLACDNLIKYSNNFYICMRSRKRILRVFSKLIFEFSKSEENFSFNYSRVNKQLQILIQSLSFIGSGTHKTWDIYKTLFDINNKLHDNFWKYLINTIYPILGNYIKDYKTEYNNFNTSWNRYLKDINFSKSNLSKLIMNRERIQSQIKEIRGIITNDQINLNKNETKITQLKEEENILKEKIEEYVKKLHGIVVCSMEFLKKTIKILRESEFKRIMNFIENLESISIQYDKIIDQNIELLKTQMEITANIDIYADMRDMYENYFISFKISEIFLEKIIKKLVKNVDLALEPNMFISKKNESVDIKNFNSGNSKNKPTLKIMDEISSIFEKNQAIKPESHFASNLTFKINSESEDEVVVDDDNKMENFKNQTDVMVENDYIANVKFKPEDEIIYQTPIVSEEEKISFVDNSNFKIIENRHFYNNVKETELKEYYEKLNKSKDDVINKRNNNITYYDIFPLDEDEKVLEFYNCAFADKILLQGKLYVTNKKLVFYSWFNGQTLFGNTKLMIPKEDIMHVEKRKNLKIFDNSIAITTKKSSLFFTSFVSRDICYNMIISILDIQMTKDDLEENNQDNIINENVELINNLNNNNISKGSYYYKIIKRMNFYQRLDQIHQTRLREFDESNKYKPESSFPKIYFKNEFIGNIPLPIIYKNIFDKDIVCEELGKEKTFWESLFELRNDFNITFEEISKDIPKYFDDIDYMISLFVNVDEESLNEFLDDVKNWSTKPSVYNYKFIHPIKKKMFGPDKLNLKDEYSIFFVSPKMLIIENINYGSGFPYADHFVSILQYRFYTNYKYSVQENIFKFETTLTIGFQIHFLKSCIFKSVIESEGFKESEENIKFNTYEKIKTVLDSQGEQFNQQFIKLSEEYMRKNIKKFNSQITLDNKNNLDYVDNNDNSESDDEINDDKIKIVNISEFTILGKRQYFNNHITFIMCLLVSILIILILGKIEYNISIDKLINLMVLVLLGFICFRLNNLNINR